jgi:hypothetical protein
LPYRAKSRSKSITDNAIAKGRISLLDKQRENNTIKIQMAKRILRSFRWYTTIRNSAKLYQESRITS